MHEHERLEEQVKQFIAEFHSVKPARLSPSTRLCQDLGVDGDDGADLMQAFAERFGVDISAFEFERHFGPEAAFNPIVFLWLWLFDRDSLRFIPITLADLVEAARNKLWQTPN